MLLIIGALLTLVAALVIIFSARARRGANTPNLGQMSEQWLAENRASHER